MAGPPTVAPNWLRFRISRWARRNYALQLVIAEKVEQDSMEVVVPDFVVAFNMPPRG